MTMAVDDDDNDDYDDDYDDDYGDDYDVGTLMNRINRYTLIFIKNRSAESAQSAGSNPQLFQIDLN